MTKSNAVLFQPYNIGKLIIPNRMVVAPMTRVSAQVDGTVEPLMHNYYENYAKGGFGLIVTEGLYTDKLFSQCYFKQPGIATRSQAASWKPIIAAVHAKNSLLIAQLMHAGALSQYNRFAEHTVGPSAIRPIGEQMSSYYGEGAYKVPQAMSEKDITDAVNGFAASALRAQEAGFDGVEIHGANGYLLDQFLTDYSNQRKDSYGGLLVNRLRIFEKIIKAVREAVSADFVVGIRFSQKKVNDTKYLWPEEETGAEYIFSKMQEYQVDYIHTTEPILNESAFNNSPSLASLAKKYSKLPVIANGGVSEPQLAVKVLNAQEADFVSLGKIALSNQDWPNLVNNHQLIKNFNFSLLSPIADLESAERFNSRQAS